MAAYIPVHVVCDKCGQLIGIVEQKLWNGVGRIEKDNCPEGTVWSIDGQYVYCEACPKKYAKQLGFETEEN